MFRFLMVFFTGLVSFHAQAQDVSGTGRSDQQTGFDNYLREKLLHFRKFREAMRGFKKGQPQFRIKEK